MLVFDKYTLREAGQMVLDLFGVGVVVALLAIFPFDFSMLPNTDLVFALPLALKMALGFVALVLGISVIVRLVRLTVNLARGTASYAEGTDLQRPAGQ
jgi:hypothetical protein